MPGRRAGARIPASRSSRPTSPRRRRRRRRQRGEAWCRRPRRRSARICLGPCRARRSDRLESSVRAPQTPRAPAGRRPLRAAVALFGGVGWPRIVSRCCSRSRRAALAPGGRLIVEFGFGQEDEVREAAASGAGGRARCGRTCRASAHDRASRRGCVIVADCLFCRIAAGEIPATMVHQDDRHRVQGHQPAGADARAGRAAPPHLDARTISARRTTHDCGGEMIAVAMWRRESRAHGQRRGYRTSSTERRGRSDGLPHPLHLLGGRAAELASRLISRLDCCDPRRLEFRRS